MTTPSPKYFCPRCSKAYPEDHRFCGHCGADMHHASGLAFAALGADGPTVELEVREHPNYKATADLRAIRGRTAELEAGDSGEVLRDRRGKDRWLGKVIDGRYRVVEIIGSGGMGVVYKVEHQRMAKVAAMKVLHSELAGESEVISRFQREAEAVSRLNHPNTVQVFDFGTAQGALYLIMEYVRGPDLGKLVKRDGPLPFLRAAPLIGQVCSALMEAHAAGIVHRDLKPENVLVTRTHGGRDFVKVLDFGLAKLSERDDLPAVTDRGLIVGTPYYMSPEQIRGEDEIDARSDIYSLGALMYKVLTGEPPFTAKTPVGVLTKHLTAELAPPSARFPEAELPAGVDELVERAMAKEAGDRYADVGELLEALEQCYVEACGDSAPSGLPAISGPLRLSGSGAAASPARGRDAAYLVDDEVDYGIDSGVRLRRSDLDAFERSMKRRRIVSLALIPIVLGGLAAAATYFLVLREQQPRTSERERNDEIEDATLIRAGSKVTGYIGKRRSKTAPDRDYYRIAQRAAADRSQGVTAAVTPIPNMDLVLHLLDGNGHELAVADEAGVGGGEQIRLRRVIGAMFVMVTQVSPEGPRLPIENVSDAYELTVTIEAIDDRAAEPNDSGADAVELRAGRSLHGYLDARKDVDTFRFDGPAGTYTLAIDGAHNVPLLWTVTGGKPRTERTAKVELSPGALIRLERADRDLPPGQSLPGADQPYTVAVRAAR